MIIPTYSGDIDGDEVPSVAGSNVGVTVGVAVGVGFISVSIFCVLAQLEGGRSSRWFGVCVQRAGCASYGASRLEIATGWTRLTSVSPRSRTVSSGSTTHTHRRRPGRQRERAC